MFTDVPLHVTILSEMEVMKNTMKEQTGTIYSLPRKEMDSRCIGGTKFATTQALEKFEAFADSINDSMQKWTNIENATDANNATGVGEQDTLRNDNFFPSKTQQNTQKRCALMTLRKTIQLCSYRSRQ